MRGEGGGLRIASPVYRIPYLADSREEVVGDLVVKGAGQEGDELAGVGVVHARFNLTKQSGSVSVGRACSCFACLQLESGLSLKLSQSVVLLIFKCPCQDTAVHLIPKFLSRANFS